MDGKGESPSAPVSETQSEPQLAVSCLLRPALIMQMVVSANGHHKVPFVDLIVDGKVGWRVSALVTAATF